MIIVQIGPFPLDTSILQGGVEASVFGLSKELAIANSVYVMDIPRMNVNDRSEEIDGLKVFRFKNSGRHQISALSRIDHIVAIVFDLNPDICHIHGTSAFSQRLFLALKQRSVPCILTVHGLVHEEKKKLLRIIYSSNFI